MVQSLNPEKLSQSMEGLGAKPEFDCSTKNGTPPKDSVFELLSKLTSSLLLTIILSPSCGLKSVMVVIPNGGPPE